MKKCFICNTLLDDDAMFCHECGAKQEIKVEEPHNKEVTGSLVNKCHCCGELLEEDSLFCPYCGSKQQYVETAEQNNHKGQQQGDRAEEVIDSFNQENMHSEAKTSHDVEELSESASILEKHKQKSKKGLFVSALLLFVVISSVVIFYWKYNSNSTESIENNVNAEAALNNENADIEGGIAYLKNFYNKVLVEKRNEFSDPTTSELGKYMTKAALNKLLVDNEYEDDGPAQYYDLEYFTDGQVQGDQHGDYMYEISREITYDSDNWYKIYTKFKDNTPPPTLIRIKVEKLGGEYIISDIEVNNKSTSNQTSTSTSQVYNMSGNVSDYPITMHIEINGSQVKGFYYYDRQYEKRGMEAKLTLSGTYTDDNLELNETDANGVPTGHFQGQLQGGIYQGEFVTNKGKRMPFRVN